MCIKKPSEHNKSLDICRTCIVEKRLGRERRGKKNRQSSTQREIVFLSHLYHSQNVTIFFSCFFFHYSPDWIRIPPFSIGKNPQFNITIAAVNRHYRELASNRICIHTVYNGKAHNWLNKFNGKWKWNALNCAAHPMAYMLMKKKEHNILLAAKETVNICLSKKNITAHFFWLRMLHENMSI